MVYRRRETFAQPNIPHPTWGENFGRTQDFRGDSELPEGLQNCDAIRVGAVGEPGGVVRVIRIGNIVGGFAAREGQSGKPVVRGDSIEEDVYLRLG